MNCRFNVLRGKMTMNRQQGKNNVSPMSLDKLWKKSRDDRVQARRALQYDEDRALGRYIEFLKRRKANDMTKQRKHDSIA